MHTTRNRSALQSFNRASVLPRLNNREGQIMPSTKSRKSAKTVKPDAVRPFMLAQGSEPRFPEDILIAPPSLPGAAIADAPDNGSSSGRTAAAPARKASTRKRQAKPKTKTVKRMRKTSTGKKPGSPRKAKAISSSRKAGMAESAAPVLPAANEVEAPVRLLTYTPQEPAADPAGQAGSPVMPPPPIPMPLRPMQPAANLTGNIPTIGSGLSVTFHTSKKIEATAPCLPDDREPFIPLARGKVVTTTGDGLVSRLVAWLGKLLPRRKRRSAMPRSRQTLARQPSARPQTAVRPSEQAEIDRLRRENKRLRGEIARLAETRLDKAAGSRTPPAAQDL